MTVKVQGNRSTYQKGGSLGIGGRNMPDGIISWVGMVNSEAGDVAYLSASDVTSSDHPYLAYSMQAVGGDVTVEYTLQNTAIATNPDPTVQTGVSWCNSTTVTPGTLAIVLFGFAAIKITFPTKGCEFYVVAR
jgi:hypothetical protein